VSWLDAPPIRGQVAPVDKREANEVANSKVEELRKLSWSDLRNGYLDNPDTVEVAGPSGVTYQLEIQAFWDSGREGNLRVIVSVDDGGWRAFMPRSVDFIVAPDGSFVGE
jgi:hypothetical protein